jgi:hypothetical protein
MKRLGEDKASEEIDEENAENFRRVALSSSFSFSPSLL